MFTAVLSQVMRAAMRVLKPGAHGLVWAIPRRSHWTAWALEDAGFEVRDCLCHYFLTGFPKSRAVDKDIDKHLGAKREVIGTRTASDIRQGNLIGSKKTTEYDYTVPTTPEAKEWQGWGTHMKPAIEHWWLVRKPLSESSVAANVLKWRTGAINIDASRIPTVANKRNSHHSQSGTFGGKPKREHQGHGIAGWEKFMGHCCKHLGIRKNAVFFHDSPGSRKLSARCT